VLAEVVVCMARLANLDALKALCCLGVICVHAPHLTRFDGLTFPDHILSAAGAFAVPTFFLLSGYFWLRQNETASRAHVIRSFIRLGVPMAVYTLFYLFVFENHWPDSPARWISLLIFGGKGFHLWFLTSLMMIMGLIFVLQRVTATHSLRFLFIVAALYGVAVLATYSLDLILVDAHQRINSLRFVRSSPLNGLYFFALGMVFRQTGVQLTTDKAKLALILGLLAVIAEYSAFYLGAGFWPSQDIKLSYMIVVPALFMVFLSFEPQAENFLYKILAQMGQHSLGIYAFHLAFIFFFAHSVSAVPIEGGIAAPALQIILVLTIFILSFSLARLFCHLRFLKILVR
jgi:surface polysaccharide O-acyltransferase-like enzyme